MNTRYEEIKSGSNEAYNKPKQLLMKILEELEANRQNVKDGSDDDDRFAPVHAIKKVGQLNITVNFINERLGRESNTIREQWKEKGYTVPNGKSDVFQTRHKKERFRTIRFRDELLNELGFDFNKFE